MKLNWGWAIVIAITSFAIFIGYFFIKGMQNPSHLVAPDYYDQEIKFQDKIDGQKRAKELGNIILEPVDDQLAITFPEAFDRTNATGTIQFYKPDNAKLDQVHPLSLDENNRFKINMDDLIRGRWEIKVIAMIGDESYYWEETINI